jgi:hypothetical protein
MQPFPVLPGIINEIIITEDDNAMANKNLIAKEELLEFVEMSGSELSKDDFVGIDSDDFIDYAWLMKNNLATLSIKKMLEIYKNEMAI